MCPNCLSWWTAYLNKGETLLCGCNVKKQDAIFLYRKTYGNRFFGISSTDIRIRFKGQTLMLRFSGLSEEAISVVADIYGEAGEIFKEDYNSIVETLNSLYKNWQLRYLVHKIIVQKEREPFSSNRNLIYIAVKKALTEASSRGNPFDRCKKCANHIGRRCRVGYEWRSVECKDFILRKSIKAFLEGKGKLTLTTNGWTVPTTRNDIQEKQ